MCLLIYDAASRRWKRKLEEHGYLWLWKTLRCDRKLQLASPCYSGFEWHPGWNNSHRPFVDLIASELAEKSVDFGIHVCLSEEDAKYWSFPSHKQDAYVLLQVRVMCLAKDFVAADGLRPGWTKEQRALRRKGQLVAWSWYGADEAVFMRAYLPYDEYRRALSLTREVLQLENGA